MAISKVRFLYLIGCSVVDTEIVDADENDVEGLIEIYSSPDLYHSREEAAWFVKSNFDYHHIKIVKNEEKIIGALFWSVVEEKHHGLAEISDFWIDENFRRGGFGERLLRATVEDMRQFFAKDNLVLRKVLVTTGDDNVPAKKLYEKVGFQRSAELTDLFATGETEIIYVLTLSP